MNASTTDTAHDHDRTRSLVETTIAWLREQLKYTVPYGLIDRDAENDSTIIGVPGFRLVCDARDVPVKEVMRQLTRCGLRPKNSVFDSLLVVRSCEDDSLQVTLTCGNFLRMFGHTYVARELDGGLMYMSFQAFMPAMIAEIRRVQAARILEQHVARR